MNDVNASPSCDLGRKEYWENFYSKELENFDEFGDEGDVWFGQKNVERIVKWILDNKIDKTCAVLDVGCGNGMTLISLGKKGYTDLTGIDYVKEAIDLAENVANNNNIAIKLQVVDFLGNELRSVLNREFCIIIDKGTYDAISLCPIDAKNKRIQYVNKIKQLLSLNGCLILFSCNWTKEELLCHFVGFIIQDEIQIPSISFGGKTGQTVTGIILKKNELV